MTGSLNCQTPPFLPQVLAGLAALSLLNANVAEGQWITGSSNYTVMQNSTGNIAMFTIQNEATPRTVYFACTASGAVSNCVAPEPLALSVDEEVNINISYSTGLWGSGAVGFAITDQLGEAWDTRESEITVNSPPQPAVLSTMSHNEHYLNPPDCAISCFQALASFTTPPYVSGDVPRSVTLLYSSAIAAPKGLVELVATNNSSTPAEKVSIRLRHNNAWVTDAIFYNSGFGTSRLAAQFDARTYSTGLLEVEAEVRSYFGAGDTASRTIVKVPVLDEDSPVGPGWRIAGIQRLTVLTDSSNILIDQGDGSLLRLTKAFSCLPQCTYTANVGDFTKVTKSSTQGDSVPWVRHYPDSSRVYFFPNGRMSYVIDWSGQRTRLTYRDIFSNGNLLLDSIVDPYGKAITLTYNSANRIVYITDPGGRRITLTYNPSDGTLYEIYDPTYNGETNAFAKRLARFEYDTSKQLRMRTDSRGHAWNFGYDFAGRLNADSAPAIQIYGGVTQRPVAQYAAPVSQVLVNKAIGLGTFSNPAARVDTAQLVASVTDPGGHTTTIKVDDYGLAMRITEPLGLVTSIARGYRRRPIRIDYPTGDWRQFGYEELGGGGKQNYLGSPVGQAHVRYGAKGQVDSSWGNGPPRRYFLSSLNGRVDSVRIAGRDSLKIRYYYPSGSAVRPDSVRDPKGHATKYHYDLATGNIDSTLAPAGRYSRSQFDVFGRTTSAWNNDNVRSHIEYDVLNRVVKSFAGSTLTDTARYEYDGPLLKRVRDPKGNIYRFDFNAVGWATRTYDPADTLVYSAQTYNIEGLVRATTNKKSQTIELTYDERHRMLSRTGSSIEPAYFGYNALGTQVIDSNAISHDSIFRRTDGWTERVVTVIGGHNFTRKYLPSSEMALDSVALTSSTGLQLLGRKYVYTPGTRNLEATRIGGLETSYLRNADGQSFTREWPNGIARTLVITPNHQVGSTSFSSGDPSFDDELWRAYDYDDASRVTQLTKRGEGGENYTTTYLYDAMGRLSSVQDNTGTSCVQSNFGEVSCTSGLPNPLESFSYDSVGNRRDRGGQFTSGNRLIAFDGAGGSASGAYTYNSDSAGNRTRRYLTADSLQSDRRYVWTADGMLSQVWIRQVGSADYTIQYAYNATGQLVRRSRNGNVDRYFIWNGDNLWLELDANMQRIAEYEYDGLDQPSTLITTTANGGLLLRYLERDQLGNVIAVTNGISISQSVDYDAWGWPQRTGTLADTARLLWKGLLWEGDSEIYYMRNRWYDAGTGRFLREDPIGLKGGTNQYAFGGGDPINSRDPFGLSSFDQCPIYMRLSDCNEDPVPDDTECKRMSRAAGAVAAKSKDIDTFIDEFAREVGFISSRSDLEGRGLHPLNQGFPLRGGFDDDYDDGGNDGVGNARHFAGSLYLSKDLGFGYFGPFAMSAAAAWREIRNLSPGAGDDWNVSRMAGNLHFQLMLGSVAIADVDQFILDNLCEKD